MPTRRRRTTAARASRRGRIRWGALVALAGIAALTIYGVLVVSRQLHSYGSSRQTERSTQAVTPPAVVASPQAAPETSPEPSALRSAPLKTAQLAIIIDDCGYSMERDRRFLQLPIPVTLSILPMTPHGKEIAAEAQVAGKFIMLHLPMEPESAQAHPGPGAITTAMTDAQVHDQVESDVESLPPVLGANNHMGSKATSDARVMRDVLGVFQERHLFFIDSLTSGSSVGGSLAKQLGVATTSRDVFLDNSTTLPYIEGQLDEAQRVALKQGSAVAIGHPNATTAQALTAYIPRMQAAGITFVPAQSLVR
ncbi:MAG: divergent polysaccharide deacetylase family protein [Candidatus Eremiobacteraeota bacterium]|nr:divergent polysaccharide deacetylase family protein [Candidatus Eremiobacteraeota bacterium]